LKPRRRQIAEICSFFRSLLVGLRNQIVVGFCNAFEKAVVALLDACRISYGDSEPRYSCYSGGTYDTAAINKWLKVYNVLLKPLPESDYFCMAVGSHSANYMQGLFWARNRIVHHGAICNTKQVTEDGSIWGCRAVGDKIKTSHNKIDDIAQFLDNNICFIFQDVDRVLP
ncbi:hypothetical protein, partial [Azospirillum brasilense]|uniref:hypothetical protein n=1 Tax=Azospirillum brasilense TaxID=192 RepID=UPI0019630266